jgi:tRNA (guanine-N7-)-methyltransferase
MRGADFWRTLFGNEAPVEIEVGSGDGAFLTAIGMRFPTRNFLGIERSPSKARRIYARITRLGVANVRGLHADAACVVASLIPSESVAAYHVYFPDPWPKRGHANRRIFSASFVAGLARTLTAGGSLFFATDVESYAAVARKHIVADGLFIETALCDDHPGLGTSFARKYRAAGRPLYAYGFVRTPEFGEGQGFAASKMRST